jgi:nuclear GTP-binding protein
LRVRTGKVKPVAATDDDDDEEMEGGMEVEDEDGEAAPLLFDADLPTLQAALEQADVLLEVVDARDPLGFRSPWLEELFVGEDEEGRKGKVVVVLTKIGSSLYPLHIVLLTQSWAYNDLSSSVDLVPREALQQWLNYLRPRFMTILFKSRLPSNRVAAGPNPQTINKPTMHPLPPTAAEKKAEEDRRMKLAPEEVLGREELLEVLERWAGEKKADKKRSDEDFVVTVAGLPNVRILFTSSAALLTTETLSFPLQVGKSSVLNTLLESTRFPIAAYPPTSTQSKPTTTTPSSSIYTSPSSSTTIKFVDTPGWIFADVFPGDDDEEDAEEKEEQEDETEEEAEMWEVIEQNRIKDLLRRNIGRVERIKEPLPLGELESLSDRLCASQIVTRR